MRSPLFFTFCAAAPLLFACSGAEAPDDAVCRDVIHRLCLEPVCAPVTEQLAPGDECEANLLARTGCGEPAFRFADTAISRERFLECRLVLARSGLDPERPPPCEDVSAFFDSCGDVVTFLKEAQ